MNFILSLCACFLFLSAVQAQDFEYWLERWADDGANAFENVEQAYAQSGQAVCGKVVKNYGSNSNGTGYFIANLEIASSKNKSRRELHTQFHRLKEQMKAMPFFKSWRYSEFIQRYFGSIRYRQEENGKQYSCELALKEWGSYEVVLLSFEYKGPSDKEGQLASNHDQLRQRTEADTTVLKPSTLSFNQDIRALLGEAEGQAAFKALLAAAENDFEQIIGAPSEANTYLVQENTLNPAAQEPHQIIVDKGQMRIELHLRFVELYGAVGWQLDDVVLAPLKEILAEEWKVGKSVNGEWQATLKNGKQHKRIVQRSKNNRDYLVIEVIKRPFRKKVAQYPQLLSGNCLEGDCISGTGVFVTQGNSYYNIRYEGGFENGHYQGIGSVYLEYISAEEVLSFDVAHYSDGKKRLLFMGQHEAGKRQGKGLAYAYAKYKDPYRNFREESEYFRKEEQTGVFHYVFQEYEQDSLQAETLCNFIYYKPHSEDWRIDRPFTLDQGLCISGDCENGKGVLKIKNLGQYEGRFVNGKANGKGILKLPTGEQKRFELYQGIPKYIRTLRLPQGVSRVAAAKRKVWLLAEHDCLAGDCLDGKGTILRISADRFRKYTGWYRGYVKAQFRDAKIDGDFQLFAMDESGRVVKGLYKEGQLDGTISILRPNEEPRYEYYQNGTRVTKDGQNYSEYLSEEIRKAEAAMKRRYEEAIAEGKREAAERAMAEARRRRAAAAQSKATKRRHSCSSCRGTGSYWNEVTTQDCTITYDFRYSHGKHYKTSTHCRDVKNGSYIRCPVCGGRGWYWH